MFIRNGDVILCGFLGVNFIAHNDVIHAVTGCHPLEMRRLIFHHCRYSSLAAGSQF